MEFLIQKAREAMNNSFSPYSNFKVGAALLTKDDQVFIGTNVENASYGATICAERSAITAAISNGYKPGDFKAIAVIADSHKPVPPCFLCRQVMTEFFDDDTQVIMTNLKDQVQINTVAELTPNSFKKEDMKNEL